MTSTPREVVFTGAHQLHVVDQPDRTPGPGELLIHVDVVGICGTDLELLSGTMGYLTTGRAGYPIVPGHEWTGIVTGIGPGVNGFTVGDRVVGECSIGCGACATCSTGRYHLCPDRTETGILQRPGGMAARLVFPAGSAHRIPPHVDPLDAALIEPVAVAYRGLQRLAPARGESIAIVGAGTIGLLSALTARALGIGPVQLIERSAARRDFAAALGLPTTADTVERFAQVLDATGTPSGTTAALNLATDGGRVVLLGLCGKPTVPIDLDSLVLRDLTLIGSLGSPGVWPEVITLVATGQIRPSTVISHRYDLAQAAQAFTLANAAAQTTHKIVLHPTKSSDHKPA